MIGGGKAFQGWASGIPPDAEATLRSGELSGARAISERFPLAKVNEALST